MLSLLIAAGQSRAQKAKADLLIGKFKESYLAPKPTQWQNYIRLLAENVAGDHRRIIHTRGPDGRIVAAEVTEDLREASKYPLPCIQGLDS